MIDRSSADSKQDDAIASFKASPGPLLLECDVQHYAWGDTAFIPELLGMDNSEQRPFAEMWMGAHPDLPSKALIDEATVPLNQLIQSGPEVILGESAAKEHGGELPFLLKVLSAATPLSIQVHPSRERARQGFARENAAGIPLAAPHRNYKDENHKPELLVALTDFYGLRGFRPAAEIAQVLATVPELQHLSLEFESNSSSLSSLYQRLMSLPQSDVDAILDPLVGRLADTDRKQPFTREHREHWVLRADRKFSRNGHRDRGLFSIYLLNLVLLRPGEGMFLPSGVPHSYLEGAGVEIMTNSNNVLRGGLTPKHVDVPELLENVAFTGSPVEILRPVQAPETGEWIYPTPAREFELRRVEVTVKQPYRCGPVHGVEILILLGPSLRSSATLSAQERNIRLRGGQALLIPYGLPYRIETMDEATIFKATVPGADASNTKIRFRGREPEVLRFGTSGLRGLVTDITDIESYINTRGFLEFLFRIEDARPGDTVCMAGDLRPSTNSPDRSILRAVARATEDAGLRVENLGPIPTPALAYYAMQRRRPSVMVTGSHIPFDRNGIKFNTTKGEVLKEDEPAILESVAAVRRREYERPADESLFDDQGMFKTGRLRDLPPITEEAGKAYVRRYVDFFPRRALEGKRIVVFEHSAVGRDLMVEILGQLGAEVYPQGRSDRFIAIDTEDITEERLGQLQDMIDKVRSQHGLVDALVSTDGDSDRPLLVAVDSTGRGRFYAGDLLGIVVADYLEADGVAVPVSASDAVDLQLAKRGITPIRTAIGSPYVIRGMQEAWSSGRSKVVVGWEANGGFLTGSPIEREGRSLEALPTRDAMLPLLSVLHAAAERGCTLVDLFSKLPARFSKAGLIDPVPMEIAHALIRRFSPQDRSIRQADFEGDKVTTLLTDGTSGPASPAELQELATIREALQSFFTPELGFGTICRINFVDGIRLTFTNRDVAHVRPSGNAPQLRIYAVADGQSRADEIVRLAIGDPDGILRRLEAASSDAPGKTIRRGGGPI